MHSEKFLLPIGPYHPVHHEPEYFAVTLEGEKIVDVDMILGYHHRGVEKIAATKGNIYQSLYTVERTCGLCGFSHSLVFCQAMEEILEIEVPSRARFIRTIIAELNRLHSHLFWFADMAYHIGFETLFMHTMGDREMVMDLLEMIAGNRVHYSMNTIGGVRRDITESQKIKILEGLRKLEKVFRERSEVYRTDATINKRLDKTGILKREKALRYGVVGPVARASGVRIDVRKDFPYAAYGDIDFKTFVETKADNRSRILVRINEVYESIGIVRKCLDKMSRGKINTGKRYLVLKPAEVSSFVEAPRGEDFHFYKTNERVIERVRIRVPTYANLFVMKEMLKGEQLADLPPTFHSIDPCFSCTDRLVVTDLDKGKRNVLNMDDLWRMKDA